MHPTNEQPTLDPKLAALLETRTPRQLALYALACRDNYGPDAAHRPAVVRCLTLIRNDRAARREWIG